MSVLFQTLLQLRFARLWYRVVQQVKLTHQFLKNCILGMQSSSATTQSVKKCLVLCHAYHWLHQVQLHVAVVTFRSLGARLLNKMCNTTSLDSFLHSIRFQIALLFHGALGRRGGEHFAGVGCQQVSVVGNLVECLEQVGVLLTVLGILIDVRHQQVEYVAHSVLVHCL